MIEVSHMVGQCIRLRAEGMLAKQICAELGVSQKVVDYHCATGLRQTGCKTSFHLVAEYAAGRVRVLPNKRKAKAARVLLVHPEPDAYEQLSKPAQVAPGDKLITGEVGAFDWGVRFLKGKP